MIATPHTLPNVAPRIVFKSACEVLPPAAAAGVEEEVDVGVTEAELEEVDVEVEVGVEDVNEVVVV
jgi:hypothetical protein